MKIEMRPVAKIKPYERNPRKNDGAVDAVVSSIKQFGFRQPIVVDNAGVIVVGHTRWKAAKKLGLEQVPVHVATDLTAAQARAYRIADNKTNELAEWDGEMLAAELAAMPEIDWGELGIGESELESLLYPDGRPGQTDADEVPEAPADPITKPGDLWILGGHRLLCGDSTKAEDVALVMDGATPFIMVTDPPYGVEYNPSWRESSAHQFGELKGSAIKSVGKVESDDKADWTKAYKYFNGDVSYIWHAGLFSGEFFSTIERAGFVIRSQIIWRKPNFVISRGHYHWQHEPCWYAVRPSTSSKWCGGRSESTTWDIASLQPMGRSRDEVDKASGHGTQKPVECMRRPIRNHGDKNDAVYDPFSGSGTTIIAAEQLNRRCYAIEIEPKYVDVAVKRWENFTGKKAERIAAGS